MPEVDADELLAVARECASTAGAVLLERFAAPAVGVRSKSEPRDLVSQADTAAESAIRAVLVRARPGDGVLGEEGGETDSATGLRWVVDPLDGTVNFLRGVPHWAVSVACEDAAGTVVVGAVADPLRGERFEAVRGRGAWLGGGAVGALAGERSRLRGSDARDLRLATLGGELSARTPAQAECSRRLVAEVGHVRGYGSAALDFAWAAAGRWDALYHGRFPAPWDVAAGGLLCREAGLAVEAVPGPPDELPRLVVAPPALLGPLRELVAG